MRILHYNVYIGQGCKDGPSEDKLEDFGRWLQSQHVDVAGLTECNNWDKLHIEKIAESWGFPHVVFLAVKSGYHLAMLSKHPLTRFDDSITQAPFYHGLLHVKVLTPSSGRDGVHIVALHSSPSNSLERERESAAITEIVTGKTKSVCPNDLVLVMGDFNNVSPLDKHIHDAQDVIGLMREVRKGKLVKRHLVDDALNYKPVTLLLDAGLTEVYPTSKDTPRAEDSSAHAFTYPTKLRPDQSDDPQLRLDLVFANKTLLAECTVTSQILRGETEDSLSDHYPILTTLESTSLVRENGSR
mmetsp:Transcript_13417/g.28532  ORF Transcript_13417/g.28532 Transcript_13417/m.28532 type:complete len:299 (+) Transcript_13417:214-1110(+)|eukprot:CAMPEP_0118952236 /NCGR_PEP_ID=MMETSP1169-20130426/54510_1 /TAXON_ID=36882 /ORGANISM="Pyramimonas obovata, Strain CCMP722" /LENGTH=298 /DNA_ID=CAMNT_0006899437 /DNA_START=159 /DNA_END=1055 /DNA_ORIENTATION=+